MNAETKVIKHKLSVPEMAEDLGNQSGTCSKMGVSLTQFYDYNNRFPTHCIEGLRDLLPIVKHHTNITHPEKVEKI